MKSELKVLVAAGVGAAAMYYLDPQRGRYRRALVRDGLVHAQHQAGRELGVVRRDARNRFAGVGARLRSRLDGRPPDDAVLEARVRTCLGRVVSHPGSIGVHAQNGAVRLTGPILEDEVPLVLASVRRVHGVTGLRDDLEVHAEPGRVPGLQGHPARRVGDRAEFLQENWAPAIRAMGLLAGAMTAAHGFRRGRIAGTLLGPAGLLLMARSATNLELRRLFGIGRPRYGVAVQKNIRIDAPVAQVFALWSDPERLPSFVTHVRAVRRIDGGDANAQWRWTVDGPGRMPVEFDTMLTERQDNRLIAWRTTPDSLIQHAGRVRFEPNGEDSTRVEVRMVYNPVAGAMGHAVARLFGADPKHQMDDDLLRIKTYLETGKAAHDAAARVHSERESPTLSPMP
jgi:uncharacterized membrane protein